MGKSFFSPDEVGKMLGRTAATVREWCHAGHLRAIRMGRGRLMIPAAELGRAVGLRLDNPPAQPSAQTR